MSARRQPFYILAMMTLTKNLAPSDSCITDAPGAALRDYDAVRRAIAFISENWRSQPPIAAMADSAGVTSDELHHLFRRWAGLTPKLFMQALTLDHAKGLLRNSASVLDAASTPDSLVRDACTTCSSRMKRCHPANGRMAAPA